MNNSLHTFEETDHDLTFFDMAAPRPWTLADDSARAHPSISIRSAGRESSIAYKYAPMPHEVHDFQMIVEAVNAYPKLYGSSLAHDALRDPNVVHVNMLRGTIARPSVEQIIHIYRPEVLRAALVEFERLRAPMPTERAQQP